MRQRWPVWTRMVQKAWRGRPRAGGLELTVPLPKKRAAGFGWRLQPVTLQAVILVFWGLLISCVVIGSLLPAASPIMIAIGRWHIDDKVQQFCAYLALASIPVNQDHSGGPAR